MRRNVAQVRLNQFLRRVDGQLCILHVITVEYVFVTFRHFPRLCLFGLSALQFGPSFQVLIT